MTNQHIIRAWKDPEYRNCLSDSERALVPEHPAGLMEVPDDALAHVAGGVWTIFCTRHRTCGDCSTNAVYLC